MRVPRLRIIRSIVLRLLSILDDSSQDLAQPNFRSNYEEVIINPRSSHYDLTEVIVPTKYEFTEEDLLSVVRPYEYINVRPPKYIANEVER